MEIYNGLRALPLPDAAPPKGLWLELIVSATERIHNHAVSPDGRHVAFYWDRNGHSDLYTLALEPSGTAPNWPNRMTFQRPFVNWWEDEPPVWTPDSQHLVFGMYAGGVSNLYVIAREGGAPRQLTELHSDAAEPAVSPDGRFIVFTTHKDGASQLALVPFDGGWVTGLTHGSDECASPVWTPDGERILFAASPPHLNRQTDICALTLGSSEPVRLTPGDGAHYWAPAPSPSGDCVALLCDRSGYDELWLMAADGSRLQQLTHINQDIEDFAWSPDGKQIVVIGGEASSDPLFIVDVESGETRRLNRPLGNHSLPRWVAGRAQFVVGFDSPTQPPELFLVDAISGEATPLTASAPSAVRDYPFVTPSHIYYTSYDGWMIPALLYRPRVMPAGQAPRQGYPALVYPHGGPTAQYDLAWDPVRQYFVAKGYVIICPNYRGSTGYGRRFKEGNLLNWGDGDLNDCLAATEVLTALPEVNPARLGIWGQSYGGYLTLLALAKDPKHRFACGVCLYGDSHLKTSWALSDHAGRQDLEGMMGHPSERRDAYEARSPLNFVANIRAPLLILHGERDLRVPIHESRQLVRALKREGKTFEYKTYPDEGHGFAKTANALDALQRIERFLDWHLL